MKITLLLSALLMFAGLTASAQTAPQPTDLILKQAYAQAAKEHKKVIIIFHASWCGWCKKMEASINDPTCKEAFDDNYVIKYLTVLESKGKENLENPGAMDLLVKYKGDKGGIPFWLVLDKDGKLLADSQIRPAGASLDTPGDNTGCPASEKEVAYFITVLKATSKINDQQLAAIRTRFLKNDVTAAVAKPASLDK